MHVGIDTKEEYSWIQVLAFAETWWFYEVQYIVLYWINTTSMHSCHASTQPGGVVKCCNIGMAVSWLVFPSSGVCRKEACSLREALSAILCNMTKSPAEDSSCNSIFNLAEKRTSVSQDTAMFLFFVWFVQVPQSTLCDFADWTRNWRICSNCKIHPIVLLGPCCGGKIKQDPCPSYCQACFSDTIQVNSMCETRHLMLWILVDLWNRNDREVLAMYSQTHNSSYCWQKSCLGCSNYCTIAVCILQNAQISSASSWSSPWKPFYCLPQTKLLCWVRSCEFLAVENSWGFQELIFSP